MSSRLAPSGIRPVQRRDGVGPFRAGAGVSRKRRFGPAPSRRIAVPWSGVETRQRRGGAGILLADAAVVAA
jgi:hypothetical protein